MQGLAGLAAIVGADQVLLDGTAQAPYLSDWRGRYHGQARAVVRPQSTAEVAAVVRYCADAGWPVVPQGGNTGLCGGATPDASGRAILLSLSRLRQIRAVDAPNNTLTAEAGCLLAEVQTAARAAGRLFPLSLAAEGSATLGGNLSTNAGGVQVLRYGNTRDLTLGLEVVLANGEVWNGLRGLRKDNTGYDLKHLFIGAEGTLGVITAATVKLFAAPQSQCTAWVAVNEAAAAVSLLQRLQQTFGALLTACELVSEAALGLVLQHLPQTRRPLAVAPWYVLFELSSGTADAALSAAVADFLADMLENPTEVGVCDAVLAQNLAQATQLWTLREQIAEAQKREGLSIKHDISLPISAIPEFLQRAEHGLRRAFPALRVVAFGHLGDGNLHYNLSYPSVAENSQFIAAQTAVNHQVYALVSALGGSISAEHGIGQLKRELLPAYKSAVELQLMQAVKAALDPRGLMNPGKVLL